MFTLECFASTPCVCDGYRSHISNLGMLLEYSRSFEAYWSSGPPKFLVGKSLNSHPGMEQETRPFCFLCLLFSFSLSRFMQELTEMLGFRPYQFYFYAWKYISPICMAGLMTACIIQLGLNPPGYSAWIREEVRQKIRMNPSGHKPAVCMG